MYVNGERVMAWVVKIDNVEKHPNADSLDICTIGGWKVVTKLNEYKVNDLAVYISIDSWVPHDLAPFLSKGSEPKEFNGVKGERIRTIKLRNAVSQGLLMSGTPCSTGLMVHRPDSMAHIFQEGDDVSTWLNIQKWEPPIPACLAGEALGLFPSFIPKTDLERIQNLQTELAEWIDKKYTWEITEKLDGCLFEGTMISTPVGDIPIENIKVGDHVISFNHFLNTEEVTIVTGTLHRSIETEWYQITMDDGTILTLTANHPVFLSNLRCYRRADQLKIGDEVTKKL